MRKKLIMDLKNLAHDILQLEEQQELDVLRKKIQEIYEKLSVLDYLNKNSDSLEEVVIDNQQTEEINTQNPVIEIQETAFQEEAKEEVEVNTIKLQKQEVVSTESSFEKVEEVKEKQTDLDDLFVPTFDLIKDDFSQKEEFKDTVSLDDTENLFETRKDNTKQLSLNDRLVKNTIQVGLNDRIAFVNKLFDYSQSEFNKVLAILNSFQTETEAKNYIQNTLKSKYNWAGKEEVEERLIFLVERKFL